MNKPKKTSDKKAYDELGVLVNEAKKVMEKVEKEIIELKKNKASKKEIKECAKRLKEAKKNVSDLTKKWRKADPNKLAINKKEFDTALLRRFFFIPSNEIYSEKAAGFFDYGPPACAIQSNILRFWRRHFVLEENMLEVDCSVITPSKVFEVSGHVAKFFDYMVRDEKTNDSFRVDQLIEERFKEKMEDAKTTKEEIEKMEKILQTLDDCKKEDFDKIVEDFKILSDEGNPLSKAFPFNLMFKTSIGPIGNKVGYLRPETAQGIFVNFKRLYDYNNKKLPFACAQVGKSFRNEISPKASILRVREFIQAEIEHFMDPEEKEFHPKFNKIKDVEIILFDRDNQVSGKPAAKMSIEKAIEKGIIKNKTLAYYIARVYLFMRAIGCLDEGIRFRQHLFYEMAHYSEDCWDCELLSSYGWYECVGIADRSCYDLDNHLKASKRDMFAKKRLKEPIIKKTLKVEIKNKGFYKHFRGDSKRIIEHLEKLSDEEKEKYSKLFETNENTEFELNDCKGEKTVQIPKDFISFKIHEEKTFEVKFTPSVIEPSFGIGRIIYCMLEHSYYIREDPEKKNKLPRSILSLKPVVAPYQACIVSTAVNPEITKVIEDMSSVLNDRAISFQVDNATAAIGRKYSRMDEIGIPFAITVDSDSAKDKKVTIRERDSCTQVRIPMDKLGETIYNLANERISWEHVQKTFEEQKQTASEKVGKKEKK